VPDAELLQMDGRRIPFAEEFDVVGAFDVIEHIEDDAAVLKQMHAATRPDGGIVLTVPQHPRLWSVADDIAHHKRRYTRRELIMKVRAAGFDVLRATSFVSLLLPAMLAARAGKKEREDFDAMSEHSFSRPVDRALRGVMAVERMLIAAGISLPAGGSLLLVARKGAAG
jgi:SAM-dependent methyltransferase